MSKKKKKVLLGGGQMGRLIHYAQLSPKGKRRRHPHGGTHYKVELSFDSLGVDGWVTIRQNGKEIDLGPEEVRLLTQLLVSRYPLDALAGARGEEDGVRSEPTE